MKNAILLVAAAALISGVASAAEYAVEKLGTIGLDMVEANPVVFKGQPWLCQYVRKHKAGRFLNLTDMKTVTPEFGKGMGMHCAFVAGDRVYVTANARKHKAFVIMDSADLVNWSEPRTIFEQPDWGNFYNSSMCRADDRYVLVGEVYGKGPEYVMSFFESKDLKEWKMIPGVGHCRNGKGYSGSPCLKYHDGWFYFFNLQPDGKNEKRETLWRMKVVRSRDLKTWEKGLRTVLDFGPEDRKIHPGFTFDEAERTRIANDTDINASDLDFREYKGDLIVSYSWGNQRGREFLALGRVRNCTEKAFCESFFKGEQAK